MFDFMTTHIPGVILIEPKIVGSSFAIWSRRAFERSGIPGEFVQDDQYLLNRGQLRGIHMQRAPLAQAKLIRTVRGSMYLVIVDLRKHSYTYGQYVGAVLSADNKRQIFMPEGCAHGFLGLSESCEYAFMASAAECPVLLDGVRYDDAEIGIRWPLKPSHIDKRDLEFPPFELRAAKRINNLSEAT